jgi:hypothetical protein
MKDEGNGNRAFALEITPEHYTQRLSSRIRRSVYDDCHAFSGSAFVFFAWDDTRLMCFLCLLSSEFCISNDTAVQRVQNTAWAFLCYCGVLSSERVMVELFLYGKREHFLLRERGISMEAYTLHTHAYSTRLRRFFTAEVKSITIS